ncbi:hypothetical protein LEMLEM_LOCUS6828, partial [Lemmus lemmus]
MMQTQRGPLNVDDSSMTGTDCGATGSETRIYPYCLFWLFGTRSLWRDTLLSLDIGRRALVLPQINVLGLLIPHRKP